MEKVTYGAPRLVDWNAEIKAGAATVRVHFTGGALTSYGITPAEFTTENEFVQKVIEQSVPFREGRIIRLRSIPLADTKPRRKAERKAPPAAPEEKLLSPSDKPASPEKAQAPEEKLLSPSDKPASPETSEAATMTEVEVTCLQDAQGYLQEHFGLSSYKVRTCEAAQRAASEYGVRFVGGKFNSNGVSESTEE